MGELWDRLPTLAAGAQRPRAPSSFGAGCGEAGSGHGGPGSAAPRPRLLRHCPACSHVPWVAAHGDRSRRAGRGQPPALPRLGASVKEHAGDGSNQGWAAACRAYSRGEGAHQPPTPRRGHSGRGRAVTPGHSFLVLLFSSLHENATSDSSRVDAAVPHRLSLDRTPATLGPHVPREPFSLVFLVSVGGYAATACHPGGLPGVGVPSAWKQWARSLVSTVCMGVTGTPSPPLRPSPSLCS